MTEPPNEGEEDTRQHELVIIRRRSDGEEDAHHGGVWKIAHADFMTALMAFFLVMWLITATDDKTVSGIANYFNPMRLSDPTTKPKGVFTMEPGDGDEGPKTSKEKPQEKKAGGKSDASKKALKVSEAELMSSPYKALDKLAEQAAKQQSDQQPVAQKGSVPAHGVGDAFRDPFDPDFQRGPLPKGRVGGTAESGNDGKTGQGDKTGQSRQAGAGGTEASHPADKTASEMERRRARAILKQQIVEAVAKAGVAAIPGIEVTNTKEGLLISITDQYDFEMFGIASAQPRPELVVLMDKIGQVIAKRPEHIVVRGYTDGRPFRSKDYDNWRLSTARAQMAHYMLVRGGVADERIDRIEGHADHDLKVRDDPLAAANRRIEILLEEQKP